MQYSKKESYIVLDEPDTKRHRIYCMLTASVMEICRRDRKNISIYCCFRKELEEPYDYVKKAVELLKVKYRKLGKYNILTNPFLGVDSEV